MNGKPNDPGYLLAARTAAVAGVVAIVVGALLLYDYSRRLTKDPLDSIPFNTLKAELDNQKTNERLKGQVRDLDRQLRIEYFRQRAFARVGAGLLLVAVAVFLVAAKTVVTLRRRMPSPSVPPVARDREAAETRAARWAVGGVSVAMVGAAIALMVGVRSELPQDREELANGSKSAASASGVAASVDAPGAATAPEAPAAEEEIAKMWPRFRGPGGLGISAYSNVPETWDAASGKGIVWKTPVPLPGNNSPVVWGERVFLSGADERRREVYCFDARSGKLLWQQAAPGTPQSTARPPKIIDVTGYAASTTATDGRRVFAIFANGDLAAFDFSGKPAWSKSLGIPDNGYGHASSLEIHGNLLLVQFDQGSARASKSRLLAFDSATGKSVWEVNRPVPSSWTSPIVIRHADREQIITAADPWVIAYSPADGAELWRVKCLSTDTGTSPTFADGKVFVANETAKLTAIRPDGRGDVTNSHVLWRGEDGLPDTCSPLATKEFVLLLSSSGALTCYDAAKGDMLWAEDFDSPFCASPSLVGNRLYLIGTGGKAWIVEPTREKCRRVSEANLGEECNASPAFQDGRIYLRGTAHLYCVGK